MVGIMEAFLVRICLFWTLFIGLIAANPFVFSGQFNPSPPFKIHKNLNSTPMFTSPIQHRPRINTRIRVPPETRLSWLEYLANLYVQCDDFVHARQIISEMYEWLVRYPRIRKNISVAIQVVQRRMDERHDCFLRLFGPNSCPLKKQNGSYSSLQSNLARMIEGVRKIVSVHLTTNEHYILKRVHQMLKFGNVSSAMHIYQQLLQRNGSLIQKEEFNQLEFILKMVRFDLENPDNCMPLWQTTCCLDWKMKSRILDIYDMLRGRECPRQQQTIPGGIQGILAILDNIPNKNDIKARLLIATGKTEAWKYLRFLTLSDRYVGRACLALRGIVRPESRKYLQHPSLFNRLDNRGHARNLYERCIYDRRLSMRKTTRCQEGLSQIKGLEKSCPYGGFVRVGLFSQIFGDYLFIKCQVTPYQVPFRMTPSFIHKPSPSRPPKPLWSPSHISLLRRLSHLIDDFQYHIHELEPLHHHALKRFRHSHPHHARKTKNWMDVQGNMNYKLRNWARKLREYIGHLKDLEGQYKRRPKATKRGAPSAEQVLDRLQEVLRGLSTNDKRNRQQTY